ncbi:hypothetical protein F2P56_000245 [Juglans regia]|uniref:Uncharacterized protein LOC109012352 n=2 Tax=Juglans regia TaxID=51240 RepID=A0A2I4H014_JUGRE|nr:uncharacterized protein LOC109012352 [Juglans regia]KAF5479425.1 hypothetical protein F2P56_000245 [Juglans regia]
MEVKLSERRDLLPFIKLLPKPTFPSQSSSVLSFHNNFRGFAQKWRFRIQEISKAEQPTKHYLVHVIKEGETLTSISKQYGVSIHAIAAANKSIKDVDILFGGQHLNIPSATRDTPVVRTVIIWLRGLKLRENHLGSLNILDGLLEQRSFNVLSSHYLPHAKTTGYFLVLVPLVAFCIRLILDAFHTRVAGELKDEVASESECQHHRCRSMRWKSVLSDIEEIDSVDAELSPHSNNHSEAQSQVSFEEMSHAYNKLEQDYQKFLSDCGMKESGHWRGGSPE